MDSGNICLSLILEAGTLVLLNQFTTYALVWVAHAIVGFWMCPWDISKPVPLLLTLMLLVWLFVTTECPHDVMGYHCVSPGSATGRGKRAWYVFIDCMCIHQNVLIDYLFCMTTWWCMWMLWYEEQADVSKHMPCPNQCWFSCGLSWNPLPTVSDPGRGDSDPPFPLFMQIALCKWLDLPPWRKSMLDVPSMNFALHVCAHFTFCVLCQFLQDFTWHRLLTSLSWHCSALLLPGMYVSA